MGEFPEICRCKANEELGDVGDTIPPPPAPAPTSPDPDPMIGELANPGDLKTPIREFDLDAFEEERYRDR